MKRILISLFALFIGFGLVMHDAEARRMGGGKSFGMQRSAPAKREAAPQQQNASPAAAPQKRSWMGPIAGIAAGLGLAALMSHLGLGEGFANVLLIALAVIAAFMLFRFLARPKTAPGMQYAGASNAPVHLDASPALGSAAPAQPTSTFPPGFDADAFAREAKLNFIRMQAANDAGNIDDIRTFTTPEMFAEIRLQLSERGTVSQQTDVMNLNAEVIECAEENGQLIASVRFHGLIREAADSGAMPFDETWHLSQSASSGGGWMVAGIQQN
jgi:predicted lipid-binding transport protein (Tim44 family)